MRHPGEHVKMSMGTEGWNRKSAVRRVVSVAFLLASLGVVAGCVYSFKGGSVPPHLKTIAIPIVEDQSGYGDPSLRDQFTRELIDKFRSDNSLELSDRNSADCLMEGVVTGVSDAPQVLSGGEKVSQRRINVTIRMTFTDLKLRKKLWEKEFTQWGDYPSGTGLTQRAVGITEAIRKLTEDVLNETVAGW
jgi:hypothetical protein